RGWRGRARGRRGRGGRRCSGRGSAGRRWAARWRRGRAATTGQQQTGQRKARQSPEGSQQSLLQVGRQVFGGPPAACFLTAERSGFSIGQAEILPVC